MTLQAACRQALDQDPAAQALEYERRWYGWGELRAVADRVCALLDAAGVAPGAPIAFVPRNRPSAVAAWLGMVSRGQTIRMVYVFQSAAGVARDLSGLKASAVVLMAQDLSPEVEAAIRKQGLAAITLDGMEARAVPGAERTSATPDPDAPATPTIEVLTSGTTGPPKRVGFDYDMILKYMVGEHVSTGSETVRETPRLLTFPLGNVSGLYGTLPALLGGHRAVLLDRLSIEGWRDFVVRYRPAGGGGPPVILRMILDADLPAEDLASIKVMMTGAAPLDPAIHQAFEEKYGIPVLVSYGATEFGGPVTLMTAEDYAKFGRAKRGSVGRPFAGARLRVIDPDTGVELPPGQDGLLEVMAPRMGAHWIRTSDIAMIDDDGFMWHRGRADGAIMRGGFKLLPAVIEHALLLHPAVAAAAVVGLKDERLGQVPVAAIKLKRGASAPTVAELEGHLRQHVYATHIPVRWRFVDELPLNPSSKVDLAGVRQLFADEAAAAS
jgi:acyl-coenzyme A synthetase/AMP-(fatty) acid ligase